MDSKNKRNHAARLAYQLAMTRGIYFSTQLGHYCMVYPTQGYVLVCGIEDKKGNFKDERVTIRKSWLQIGG